MYKILPKLKPKQLNELLALQSEVKMVEATSHRRRIGVNGNNKLSIYRYSRYLTWTAAQRERFSAVFPEPANSKAFIKWFVEFPPEVGFLDRLETWTNQKNPAWYTCFNIKGSGKITVDDKDLKIPVGNGICYSLGVPHEMKSSASGGLWACVVTFNNVWE